MGVHAAGSASSSATRGREREAFIDSFLSGVFPSPFRWGSGDITDHTGARSGQIDVVVEYPFLPSFPIIGGDQERLYLAEGVAAAIEVKSDVSGQWGEVESTQRQLGPLTREFGATMIMGDRHPINIPLFAVGYRGWSTLETVQRKVRESGVAGILVIEHGLFASGEAFGGIHATGPLSLLGLISCIHNSISSLKMTSANPIRYGI
jgi:hypothetical protein